MSDLHWADIMGGETSEGEFHAHCLARGATVDDEIKRAIVEMYAGDYPDDDFRTVAEYADYITPKLVAMVEEERPWAWITLYDSDSTRRGAWGHGIFAAWPCCAAVYFDNQAGTVTVYFDPDRVDLTTAEVD